MKLLGMIYRHSTFKILFAALCGMICYQALLISAEDTVQEKEPIVIHHHHSQDNQPTKTNCVIGENQSNYSGISILYVGLLSSLVFAFIGVLPAFFIKVKKGSTGKKEAGAEGTVKEDAGKEDLDVDGISEDDFKNSLFFKILLSFAAGSILAEVFLHYIPHNTTLDKQQQILNGLLTIGSFFLFMIIEKISDVVSGESVKALGILNLLANVFDNSAHGSTVVGAFQTSLWMGIVALIATLLHEVPHEFADFALLLKSGYSKQTAVFGQLATAFVGSFASVITYYLAQSATVGCQAAEIASGGGSSWILCFTTGGFLYIALVGIIPEIMEEKDKKTSILQFISFITGVFLIYVLLIVEDIVMPSL